MQYYTILMMKTFKPTLKKISFLKLSVLMLLSVGYSYNASTQCDRERDSLALIALYNSTDGPNWTNTWDLNEPIDMWYGIEVNGDGCVSEVVLPGNNLQGTIPNEITTLSELIELSLSQNSLTGSIPTDIGDLSELKILALIACQLSGEIPSSLYELTNLEVLLVPLNNLSGSISNEIGNLLKLERLLLWRNQFDGEIPARIGELLNLRDLFLSFNQFSGEIPNSLGALINLRIFDLQENQLTGDIPIELTELILTSAGRFFLNDNNLSGCYPEDLITNICFLGFEESGAASGYNLTNNPSLPWQGDFERFCNGDVQIGVSCDDGNPNTTSDVIQSDCSCLGEDMVSCRFRDSLALVELYLSTDGPNWTTTWDLNDPLNTWYGIELNLDGCVTCIDLDGESSCGPQSITNGNNLIGELPSRIGDLKDVQYLYLARNSISGSIPKQIGHMEELIVCRLEENGLTGQIPTEIGNLLNLEELFLARNELVGYIPITIGNLLSIEQLWLSENMLFGNIPSSIGSLENLSIFSAYSNQLSGNIPNEIGSAINLWRLFLNDNNLSGVIPMELGSLTSLEIFTAENNQISGILPPQMGNLRSLIWLDLSNNLISGSLPDEFNNLSLREFYINNNHIEGCYPASFRFSICPFGNNAYDFSSNPLLPWEGDFERFCNGEEQIGAPCNDGDPLTENDEIQDDCNCRGVLVNDCRERDSLALVALYNSTDGPNWTNTWDLSDPIDMLYGIEVNGDGCVTCIDLDGTENCQLGGQNGNGLIGEIPIEIGELASIEFINFASNTLSGIIPMEIGNLSNLVILNLFDNSITGPIPETITNLTNLSHVNFGNNQLSGELPTNLNQLTALTQLLLNNNEISGEIPANIGSLSSLTNFTLSNNNLSGLIPNELYELVNLERLTLSNNNLSGELSSSFINLENLRLIQVSNNNLSGLLPEELADLSNLENLFLDGNNFDGCFPEDFLITCSLLYNFTNNPLLPWEGDFERFCNGEEQIGAPCNDGDSLTENDEIQDDCSCRGVLVNDCRERDSLALVALYNSTDGPNWTNTWDLSDPIDSWYGIELSGDGCVEEISIDRNNLTGNLPSLSFARVKVITLSFNSLSGSIPLLDSLPSLEVFQAMSNNFTGIIPQLDNVPSLRNLRIGSNQLSGDLPSLNNVPDLEWFSCRENNLTGSIPQLTNTPLLRRFWCSANNLSGSIPDLSEVPMLLHFSCGNNNLIGSIPLLNNATSLKFFTSNNNDLSGSLPDFDNTPLLIEFSCADNNLTGTIPEDLGSLQFLERINIGGNNLSECFPVSLTSLCPLGQLIGLDSVGYNFTNNPLLPWEGDFERFCNGEEQIGAPCNDGDPLTNNDVIQDDCSCRGVLVNDCRERDSLALIALYNSTDGPNWTTTWDLSEPIDMWYGIEVNGDGCVICVDLDGDPNCSALIMGGNNLNGIIPEEIGQLQSLEQLYLGDNGFFGGIPSEIGSLVNLINLNLDNNNLNEEIPAEIGNLINLITLSINSNQLSGEIPIEIGELTNLRFLSLVNNSLDGPVIPELGNLINLNSLQLSRNLLIGEIPIELEQLSNLQNLAIASNQLTGNIPDWINSLSQLTTLQLQGNQLDGPIPASLFQLQNLRLLALSNNQLTGTITNEIGSLQSLERLILNDNLFNGAIPNELNNLNNLMSIDLSSNNLDDCLPVDLSSICALGSLNGIPLINNGYNFTNNPLLPWQGDFEQFCNGEEQIGAPCNDGDPLTENDEIQDNCSCRGEIPFDCVINVHPDYEALLAFYNSTNGNNWINNNGWVDGAAQTSCDPCDGSWYGVLCNVEGRVVCVDMDGDPACGFDGDTGNNLGGTLPEEITDLSELESLILDFNNIGGRIPENIIQLQNLQRFTINSNMMEGPIPLGMGNMTDLNIFIPGNNNFSGCFPEDLLNKCGVGNFDFVNNPLLPWQGNFNLFCNGSNQIGAGCNDGDASTTIDVIREDCTCGACEPIESMIDTILCPGEVIIVNNVTYDSSNLMGTEVLSASTGCDSTVSIFIEYIIEPMAVDDNIVSGDEEILITDVIGNDVYNDIDNITVTVIDQQNLVFVEVLSDYNIRVGFEPEATDAILTYELCDNLCGGTCVQGVVELKRLITIAYDDDVITPNGDGINDILVLPEFEEDELIPDSYIRIFNRWGQLVYQTDNYSNNWRGHLDGDTSKPLPEGIYYYHLLDANNKAIFGSRSLIR